LRPLSILSQKTLRTEFSLLRTEFVGIRPQKLGKCENHLHICSIIEPNEFLSTIHFINLILKTIKMKTNTFIIGGLLAFSLTLSAQNYASKSVKSFDTQDQSNNLKSHPKISNTLISNPISFDLDYIKNLNVFQELNDLGEDFFVTFQSEKAIGRCQTTSIQHMGKVNKIHDDFFREMRLELHILTQ
jgi:hypothetical protein